MNDPCIPLTAFIDTLRKISDFVDVDTEEHSKVTGKIAVMLASRLGIEGDALDYIHLGADIHDIGKISISPVVFRQTSRLTRAQRASVEKHPEFGYEMVHVPGMPEIVEQCVLYHHEHRDGSGYPLKLKGNQIPLAAQIVCVADVWESINANRPYRRAMTRRKALDFMTTHITWFGPRVYSVFKELCATGDL